MPQWVKFDPVSFLMAGARSLFDSIKTMSPSFNLLKSVSGACDGGWADAVSEVARDTPQARANNPKDFFIPSTTERWRRGSRRMLKKIPRSAWPPKFQTFHYGLGDLGVSRSTASKHVENILKKMKVPNRTAAASLSWQN